MHRWGNEPITSPSAHYLWIHRPVPNMSTTLWCKWTVPWRLSNCGRH